MWPRSSTRTRPVSHRHRHARPRLEALEGRAVPAGIPVLNSNPGAPATLYLDFDGHYEASWGAYSNITTPVFNQDGDPTSFSDAEIATIRTVWERAAEDYAPFNINVTTVEPAVLAPGVPAANANGKAMRVSIGGDSSWMGASWGGYAYINSFTSSIPNVCFVFDTGNDSPAYWIGDSASHEAGHSFGLQHQSTYDPNGVKLLEYNIGNTAWSPLMGTSAYSTATTTWYNGTTTSATTFQDDLAVIAGSTNGFGFRADDHGNTAATATPLTAAGGTWAGAGRIGTNADVDYFSFTVPAADTYRITAGGPGSAANLDAVIELRNAAGQLLETANPTTTLTATIVRSLTPGTYTVAVKSTGVYGWIGTYTLGIDAPPAGIRVTPSSPTMTTHEDGRTTSFTVVLETAPLGDVVIPVNSSNPGEATTSTGSLVFTPANWNVPQTVTVTGVADGVVDGDVAYTVVLGPATSDDAEYSGRDPADLAAVNVDADEAGFLYFADNVNDSIGRARLNGGAAETLVDLKAVFGAGEYSPYGVVADVAGGRLYWIDRTVYGVYRANLDGSGAERLLTLPAGSPWSLALDPVGGKLYWVDQATTAKKIWRANLDGSDAETVLTSTAGAPIGIALDPAAGKMYWTEYNAANGTIRRANLDGSNVETVWVGGPGSASTAIALDVAGGTMYWVDDRQDLIHRANLDGSGAEVVVTGAAFSTNSYIRGLALDPTAGKLYWQDLGPQTIYRADLDGSNVVGLAAVTSSFGMAIGRPPAGISVTGRTGLVTTEGSGGASFRVVLTTKPTANVTIPVSTTDPTEGTASVTSLTFTPTNWSVPQTVTITSVEDAAVDGNVAYTIVLGAATSADPTYNGLNPADATVTNNDNDYAKFFTVDDASTNRTYRYGAVVNGLSNSVLNSNNSAPRGLATTAAGDKVWVVDANKKVYVYSATSGALLGSWSANSLDKNATVEGITVFGNDVWLVDAKLDRVYRYANAAGRLSGTQNATSSFQLHANNVGPKDLVTDGTSIWVVDDQVLDKVYKYTLSGTYVGAWAIDPANGSPTGITLDPANPRHLWIVDSGTDRVYQYDNAVSRTSGSQTASVSYALAAGNTNPQGIADPPPAWLLPPVPAPAAAAAWPASSPVAADDRIDWLAAAALRKSRGGPLIDWLSDPADSPAS
jgi:hypothetical protein